MKKKYVVQLCPFVNPAFLHTLGEVVYQTDYISHIYGIVSTENLIERLKEDERVKVVAEWFDFGKHL